MNLRNSCFCLLMFAFTACNKLLPAPLWSDTKQSPYSGPPHYFILAGQSNMLGSAAQPDPAIKVTNNKPSGPGFYFAQNLKENVVLIQCAVGSTSIDTWTPQGTNYQNCINLWHSQGHPKLDGVLFYQGEADALVWIDPQHQQQINDYFNTYGTPNPNNWANQFDQFVAGIRRDTQQSTLPIIYAQIGNVSGVYAIQNPESGSWYGNWQDVQTQQQNAPKHDNLTMISAQGESTDNLGIHLTEASQTDMGHKFAMAFWNMTPN